MTVPTTLPGLLSLAINIVIYLIIIDIIISYSISFGARLSPYSGFIRGVRAVVAPLLNPIRRLMPPPSKTWGWDFSPMIAVLLLELLQNIIVGGFNIGAAR